MPTASDHIQERGECLQHVAVLLIIEADLADGVAVFEFIEEEIFRLRNVLYQGVADEGDAHAVAGEVEFMGSDPLTKLDSCHEIFI